MSGGVSGKSVKITVNGEEQAIPAMTVYEYLEKVLFDTRPVAIELNREILPKKDYKNTILTDGDQLEIVWFVGGG